MRAVEILDQLRSLPAAERREVVEKIWDEFADRDLEPTPKQMAELDRRLADHQENPNDVVGWQEMKAATDSKFRQKS
ncbi:MAG TPA: addiction module protein [Opitutaceae bacterium]